MPLIKRYSNRKLYDTHAGQYVTLEDIARFIRDGEEVKVVDHETGRDLTSLTLMQVLLEEQRKIGELLPEVALTRLIRLGEVAFTDLRERILAALDPQGQTDEEIRRRVESLVEKGELSADEAQEWLGKLAGGPAQSDDIHTPEPSAETAPHADYQMLAEQVEKLEKQLKELSKRKSSDNS